MGTRAIVAALIALLAAGCAPTATITGRPGAPGMLFAGPLLEVRAPAAPGWNVVQSDAGAVAFRRDDRASGKSYVAQVALFQLPAVKSADEFLEVIRTGFEKDTPPERYRVTDSKFALTTERPYSCVRVRADTEDMKARTPYGTRAMPLRLRSLYCQHPTRPLLGIHAAYSERGSPPDPDLDAQAESFITGVQVPAAK